MPDDEAPSRVSISAQRQICSAIAGIFSRRNSWVSKWSTQTYSLLEMPNTQERFRIGYLEDKAQAGPGKGSMGGIVLNHSVADSFEMVDPSS